MVTTDYIPTVRDPSFDPKKPYGSLTLAKHLEMIALINHSRTASEYHTGHRLPFHPGSHNYLYSGVKPAQEAGRPSVISLKTSVDSEATVDPPVKPSCDLTKELSINSPVDANSIAFRSAKISPSLNRSECNGAHHENAGACGGESCDRSSVLDKPYENHSFMRHTSLVDRVTVPVLVSCANSLTSQYGGYGRKVFPCPQCRYTTDRRNNLKRHMLTMHQTCSKTLECCGILFATKASLREHAMIFHYHGYTCYYCGRRFCRKALLKRHLSVHNGQKDFVCSVCDYATSHKSNLERHRKVHCRSDEERQDKMDCERDHMTIPACVWGAGGHRDIYSVSDYSNADNVSSSSDDENAEINVVSD